MSSLRCGLRFLSTTAVCAARVAGPPTMVKKSVYAVRLCCPLHPRVPCTNILPPAVGSTAAGSAAGCGWPQAGPVPELGRVSATGGRLSWESLQGLWVRARGPPLPAECGARRRSTAPGASPSSSRLRRRIRRCRREERSSIQGSAAAQAPCTARSKGWRRSPGASVCSSGFRLPHTSAVPQ